MRNACCVNIGVSAFQTMAFDACEVVKVLRYIMFSELSSLLSNDSIANKPMEITQVR